MELESKKQIGYGTLLSYAMIIFNTVAGFIYTPWMIKTIGDNNYALYSMVISLINFFLMDFGLSTATQRYVAKYAAENKKEQIKDLLGVVFKLYLIIMGVITVVLAVVYLLIDKIYANLGAESLVTFKNLFLIFAVYCVINFPFTPLNGILNGLEQFKITKMCDLISRLLIILLIVICLFFGGNVYTLVLINAVVGIFFVGVKLVILFNKLNVKVNIKYRSAEMTKGVLSFSVWVTVYGIANRFAVTLTPQILGIFSVTKEVTVYTLASQIEGNAYTLITVLGSLFLPEVSRILSKDNSRENLQALMTKVGRIQGFIGYLAIVGFAAIGLSFVRCWMGAGYDSVYICTLLMLVPNIVIDTQTIAGTALDADNKVMQRALLCIGQAALSLGLSSILAGILGAYGACIGLFASYILKLIGLNIFYKKYFGINIRKFFKDTIINMLPPIIISLAAGFVLEYFLKGGWIMLGIKAIIITAVYCAAFWVFSAKKDEKELIKNLKTKLLRSK